MAELDALIAHGVSDYSAWRELVDLLDQRRRLVESERKRILDASQAITVDEAFYLMSALSGGVRDYVSDNEILRKIQARFTELMRRQDLPGAEWRNEP